jgi:hypothetical protein
MSTGIDYSKWDTIDYGSSDDEGSDEVDDGSHVALSSSASGPRVTKLDQPSKVTRTADGRLIVEDLSMPQTTNFSVDGSSRTLAERFTGPRTDAAAPNSLDNNMPSHSTGDPMVPDVWTEKGSAENVQGCQLYWSQDRYSVTLRILLPTTSGKWTCHATNLLTYDDRYVTVGSAPKAEIEIRRVDDMKEVVLQGELAYPVHTAEGEQGLDWSIETVGDKKVMVVTMYKATPMTGVTVWWKRPLSEMKEISMEWRDQAATDFQQVWNEAHAQFKNKQRSLNKVDKAGDCE